MPRGIHSQTLYDGPDLRLVLFAFAPGEELSEHTAARPAVVHVLDGEGDAVVGGDAHAIAAGTWFRMPAADAPLDPRPDAAARRPLPAARWAAEHATREGRIRALRHV